MVIGLHALTTIPSPPQGNGYKLTHSATNSYESGVRTSVAAELVPGFWRNVNGRPASREELMMALASVENILIRMLYTDQTQREVELLHIVMDSAASQDRGLGSATLVEECRCPSGYTGLSCENCAHGFVRQKSGRWLGRCAPEADPCRTGTYGDPANGVPCRECPCPLVGGQNFARSCALTANNDVRCDCRPGYTGARCEQCAAGYVGTPLQPGGSCEPYRPPVSRCDERGTERQLSDGRCECKKYTTGAQCNQCTPEAFHLNANSADGCVSCFCMGVSTQCSSSSWYRETQQAHLTRSQFALITDLNNPETADKRIESADRELSVRFDAGDTQTYWWKLPVTFTGSQLTAYGGHLNYTVRFTAPPGGAMSRNGEPDVVIRSRNDYTVMHFRRNQVSAPGVPTPYAVVITEDEWIPAKGGRMTREHMLMALADVTDIFVKATYTTTSESAGLLAVSLDGAAAQPKGHHGRGGQQQQRASEVEQCVCPEGHEGLSCERCSPGYGRDPESGSGLYLGLCERCQCNGHSEDCEPETGRCQSCRHNTDGAQCELCAPGFAGNATMGTAYDCQPSDERPTGGESQHGCGACDERGTSTCDERGECVCKANVDGARCDRCRAGTFNLAAEERSGCTECFCSGVTQSCAAASLWRLEIPTNPFEDLLALTDRRGQEVVSAADVGLDLANNRYTYRLDGRRDALFWSLPDRFTGNQVLSYGGRLTFTVDNVGYGPYVPDQDVLLIGNGITLFWHRNQQPSNAGEVTTVQLVEKEWQSSDRNSGLRPASRADLLTVLSGLQSVLVRATFHDDVSETYISDVTLETAVTSRSDRPASEVEKCHCPAGYRGSSCEVSEWTKHTHQQQRFANRTTVESIGCISMRFRRPAIICSITTPTIGVPDCWARASPARAQRMRNHAIWTASSKCSANASRATMANGAPMTVSGRSACRCNIFLAWHRGGGDVFELACAN